LSEVQTGLIPPREFIFDPSPVPLAPTTSFTDAMQMIVTKLVGSYFPQELVDKVVMYLIDLHPRPGQRAIHCSILRLLGTEAWPRNREVRQLGTHPLDYASVTLMCYNVSDYQSFLALRNFSESQRGSSYPQYLRKWVFLVATSDGNCRRAVSRREELTFISDVRNLYSLEALSPAMLGSYNLRCNTRSLVEVENVFQSVVDAVGWTERRNEHQRELDEIEAEVRRLTRIGRIEEEKLEKRKREEMKQTGLTFKLGKFIGKLVGLV
jgi:hypothetical protein